MRPTISPVKFIPFLAALLIGADGCVYFNTFYNAQKYFRQAEKARKEETERQRQRGAFEEEERRIQLSAKTEDLYEEAARKAFVVLEDYPESDLVDDAAFLMARAFYWQSNYLNAVRTLKDLEDNFPDSEYYDEARYWRAMAHEQQGDRTAEGIYRDLFAGGDEDLGPKSGFRLGEMAFAAKLYAEAVQEYRTTLEAYPHSDLEAELYLRLGEVLFALADSSRYEEAVAAFARVGSSAERRIEYSARLHVGEVEYARGDDEGALETFQGLLKESKYRPFEGRTRLAIGQLYRDRSQTEAALREFERVRDDFPGSESSAMALYRTGLVYLQDFGDTERAEEYFRETREEKPSSEGARLGQLIVKDLDELQRLRRRIFRADSLQIDHGNEIYPSQESLGQELVLETSPTAHSATGSDADSSAIAEPDSLVAMFTPAPAVADSTAVEPITELVATDPISAEPVPTVTARVDSAAAELERTAPFGGDEVPEISDSASVVFAGATGVSEPGTGEAPSWFFALPTRTGSVPLEKRDEEIADDLFTMAEIFRAKIEHPDSAAHYFSEIVRRYPRSEHVRRALFAIAWVHMEMSRDEGAARPFLDVILRDYPTSEQANAARRYLGFEVIATDEELALAEFIELEQILVSEAERRDRYVPQMDSLAARYPDTGIAARAAFRVAWQFENVARDTVEAVRRYDRLLIDFPTSEYAELVEKRREAEKSGLIEKLERELKSVGGVFAPGEYIDLIAVEPDSADSVILSQKHFRFGLRAYNRGLLDRAREEFELSIEQQQRNPDALHLLGNVLWQQGYPGDAIDRYQEVLRFNGNHLGVRYSMFGVYVAEGVADSANHYLSIIVNQDRSNPQVQFLLEEYSELDPSDREELDMYRLEQIEFEPPEDNLALRERELRLAERPLVRRPHLPAYPAGGDVDSAEVILDILIGRNGQPKDVEVFAGEEPFRTAALEAAEQYQFYPATRRHRDKELRPLQVWVELVLPFARTMADVMDGDQVAAVDPEPPIAEEETGPVATPVQNEATISPTIADSSAVVPSDGE